MTDDPHKEKCLELARRLSEFLDDELDPDLVKEIRTHVDACKKCRSCFNTLKQTVALVRYSGTVSDLPALPKDLSDKLARIILKNGV